ncbi:hypothetical protein HPP92_009223 [Vanilla planifolia]|uniref:Uncharacterized protein n=1 Tax=Vanilla planifolia TaxID=51239 RepID=A0A835RA77_VANPL|nr:hypothetical protein HPP92_009223 [Vanilla planifolia]
MAAADLLNALLSQHQFVRISEKHFSADEREVNRKTTNRIVLDPARLWELPRFGGFLQNSAPKRFSFPPGKE